MISSFFDFELTTTIDWLWFSLGLILIIVWIIQLHYILLIYSKPILYKKKDVKPTTDPVSVIICARNEAENLKEFLPSILNQFYPEFQVIVVDDGSSDETPEVLSAFKQQYPQLYVTTIEDRPGSMGGKKLAQTIGIKAAKFDQLLFTDADCYPVSPNWIRHMQSNFLNRTEIVLGYGAYASDQGLLNKWVRTDTVYIAMQYFSFALLKKAFMGVGRNLSYRKTLFFKNKGFASHLNLASGDDDLFINETSNEENTSVELHPESFTYSKAKSRWKYWIQQKRRHLSTSRVYKKAKKTMLMREILSRELFYILSIGLLAFSKLEGYVLIILVSRTIAFLIIFKLMMKRLKERNLLLLSLIYDLLWPLMASYLMITSKLKKKPTRWK